MSRATKFQEIGVETDITLPPPLITKKVREFDYFNVILIVGKLIEGNWLFFNEMDAEKKYLDVINEYSFAPLKENEIEKYLKDRFAILEKVSIIIDRPIVN